MQMILGTSPLSVGAGDRTRLVIQNMGPGLVEFNTEGTFAYGQGISLPVNAVYEFPSSSSTDDIWLVASVAATQIRLVRIG